MNTSNCTEDAAYDTAMEMVAVGHNFGAVPVIYAGEVSVYTTSFNMPEAKDDTDAIAHAIYCIRHAREQAEQLGAHPVD